MDPQRADPVSSGSVRAVPPQVAIVLVFAVLGISSSAVLVRFMEAPPIAIAAWRCLFAALILLPVLWRQLDPHSSADDDPPVTGITTRDFGWIAVGGVFLGLHFASWFASLDYTSVLRSTVLVALVPVWTGLFEWGLTGRRPVAGFWLGIGLALAGVATLSTTGGTSGWQGDLLAVGASVLWSVYLLVGRDVRQRVPIGAYMCIVSGVASLSMWPLAFATGTPVWGFPLATWGWMLLATLGPQLMGHQGFSYAVKYLPASTVAAIMLLEPVGSTLLAAALLAEVPPPTSVISGAVVVVGVYVALKTAPKEPEQASSSGSDSSNGSGG